MIIIKNTLVGSPILDMNQILVMAMYSILLKELAHWPCSLTFDTSQLIQSTIVSVSCHSIIKAFYKVNIDLLTLMCPAHINKNSVMKLMQFNAVEN